MIFTTFCCDFVLSVQIGPSKHCTDRTDHTGPYMGEGVIFRPCGRKMASVCHLCPSLWTDKSGQCRLFSVHRISLFLSLFTKKDLAPFLANVNSRSRSLYAIARPSVVCRLSVCLSVTFVRPTQAVEIFGNISTALGTLVTH